MGRPSSLKNTWKLCIHQRPNPSRAAGNHIFDVKVHCKNLFIALNCIQEGTNSLLHFSVLGRATWRIAAVQDHQRKDVFYIPLKQNLSTKTRGTRTLHELLVTGFPWQYWAEYTFMNISLKGRPGSLKKSSKISSTDDQLWITQKWL